MNLLAQDITDAILKRVMSGPDLMVDEIADICAHCVVPYLGQLPMQAQMETIEKMVNTLIHGVRVENMDDNLPLYN